MLIIHVLLLIISALFTCAERNKDFYTSIAGLEDLLQLERRFLDNLKDYVDREIYKFEEVKKARTDFEIDNREASNNPDEYFSNPIGVFRMFKRFVVGFKDLNNNILQEYSKEEFKENVTEIKTSSEAMPKEDDLNGAASGLVRLQKTYRLEVTELANGSIMGTQYSTAMSASDIFYIGKHLYEIQDYKAAVNWLSSARERLDVEVFQPWSALDKIQFLEFFSEVATVAGQTQLALNLTKELLLEDSKNTIAMERMEELDMDMLMLRNNPNLFQQEAAKEADEDEFDRYEATCRGDRRLTPSEERPLRCMYVKNNVPFLTIAPFKMEQLLLEPLIVYYHDVIYESEIEQVLRAAAPKMTRSKVGNNADTVISTKRTSKSAWLRFSKHPFIANIGQRLRDITQLSLYSATSLQVANYGIGGHYAPHFDFSCTPEAASKWRGNRIATALFYISNVEHGGATAFPLLKLAVKPIRRSLVFWHNLHKSGDKDFRMFHAGCPVLKGSKWILNLWLHVAGQEFIRPCDLQNDAHLSAKYNSTDHYAAFW